MRPAAPVIGVSLKMYFGQAPARAWFDEVAARVRVHDAVMDGAVELFITPTYLQVLPALEAFRGTPVRIGTQNVAAAQEGAFTGEVSAGELAEVGATLAEIGHAERRRLFGETDRDVAAKTRVCLANGIAPLLCIGEEREQDPNAAADIALGQLRAALADAEPGSVIVAYEPIWAIGASQPAGDDHVRTVVRALRDELESDPAREGSSIIYGGAAGPGLLTGLADDVDGVFLGRFAHDPDALVSVLDEAADLARRPAA